MRNLLFATVLALSLAGVNSSQPKPLVKEWIEKDLFALKQVRSLCDRRFVDPETAAKALNVSSFSDAEDLGFGGSRYKVSKGFGYTKIEIYGFAYKGKLFRYGVLFGDSSSWDEIRELVINAWKSDVGVPYKENSDSLYCEFDDASALEQFRTEIDKDLGSMRSVAVPASLRADYEALISPYENPIVGFSGCGAGGVLPWGKSSIDSLTQPARLKLLENVLRGFNPGGRVYALVELSKISKKQKILNAEVLSAMAKVGSSNVPIQFCSGGTIVIKTANDILEEIKVD